MATITIKIADEVVIEAAKQFAGFSYPPGKVPSTEEHIAAIESKIYELLEVNYEAIVKSDAEVIAKEAELRALVEAKLNTIKDGKK